MRNGNPNLPSNPYQTNRTGQALPGQVNNPQSYGTQRAAGQIAQQPNLAGYGGGTNTTNYNRGYGTQQPAPLNPSIPTPVPQPPVYNNPADPAQIAKMWWLPQNQAAGATTYTAPNGVVYNYNPVPGGNAPGSTVQMANGGVGHIMPSGMVPTPGSGYAYGPAPGSFQGFGQMLGGLMPNNGGGNGNPYGGWGY